MRRGALALSLLIALFCLGCPGDGSRLVDEVIPGDGGAETVTLAQLQQDIFGAVCSNCHVPGGLAAFMRLDTAEQSYASLVDQPSLEIPRILRVAPGDPDASYVVMKVENVPGIVGDPMPPPGFGESPLTEAEIAAIRQWILDGALP